MNPKVFPGFLTRNFGGFLQGARIVFVDVDAVVV